MELAEGAANQTRQVLTNMGNILAAAGCDFSNVVKTTILMQDINEFAEVNKVYAEFFPAEMPARAAYEVS